ncbi:YcjF family protein [Shewanella sp. JM162201]|uniref:YcjF family protein n=1 Tax=Shewanella jiangmenensis TaxID=2837387 RepID=A0ABS5UYM7_9GAMM|nr:TIGR01620 family protein [Shewanella jiangmenensis]MBT1443185.1 YcjF family protein [Shewanella jiangmenensis]
MNNDTHIAPARRFDEHGAATQTPLKEAKRFDADAAVLPDESEIEAALEPLDGHMELQGLKGKRWSGLAKWALTGLGVLALTETVLTLIGAYQQSPWLFGLYATVLGLVLAWGLKLTVKELLLLRRLKATDDAREQAQRIRLSVQTGEADGFIEAISAKAPAEALARFNELSSEYQNDAEKLALYEECVLTAQDKAARKKVSRYAMESAALLAASPLAVLDMAVILWRNQKMIRDVADCYGVELGYWSRIRLIRAILLNIFYAGTTELVTDLGSQLLSVEMTGKLSARLAQGLGGGLLTARLGYQAMALCRPLTFLPENKPRLSRIHTELMSELKSLFSGALNGQVDSRLQRNKDFTNS